MGYREDQAAEAKVLGFLPSGRTAGEDDLIKMLDKQVETDGVIKEFSSLTDKTEISGYIDRLQKTGREDLVVALLSNPESAKVLKPFTKRNESGNFSLVFPADARVVQTGGMQAEKASVIGSSSGLETSDIIQIANSISTYQDSAATRIASFEAAGVKSGKTESALATNEAARLKGAEEALGFLMTSQTEATADAMIRQQALVKDVSSDPVIQAEAVRLKTLLQAQDEFFVAAKVAKNQEQELRTSFKGRLLATGGEETVKRFFPELANVQQDLAFAESQSAKVNAAIQTTSAAMASHLKFRQDLAAIKTPEEIKAEGLANKFKTQQVLESAQRGVDITNVEVAKANEKRVLEATKLVEDANSKVAQLQIQLGNLKLGADKTAINAQIAEMRLTSARLVDELTKARTVGQNLENKNSWVEEGIISAEPGKVSEAARILLQLPVGTSEDRIKAQFKAFGGTETKRDFAELFAGSSKRQGVEALAFYQQAWDNNRLQPVIEVLFPQLKRVFGTEHPETRKAVMQNISNFNAAVAVLVGDKPTKEAMNLASKTFNQAVLAGSLKPEEKITITSPTDKTKKISIDNPSAMTLAGTLVDPATLGTIKLIGTDDAALARLASSPLYNSLYLKETEIKKVKKGAELDSNDVANAVFELSAAVKTEEERKKLAMDAVDVMRLGVASSNVRTGMFAMGFPVATSYPIVFEQRGLFIRIADAIVTNSVPDAIVAGVAGAVGLTTMRDAIKNSGIANGAASKLDALNSVKAELPKKGLAVDLLSVNDWLTGMKYAATAIKAEAIRSFQPPAAAASSPEEIR